MKEEIKAKSQELLTLVLEEIDIKNNQIEELQAKLDALEDEVFNLNLLADKLV